MHLRKKHSSKQRAGSGAGGARVPKRGIIGKWGTNSTPFLRYKLFLARFFADKNMCQGCPYLKKGVLLKICIGVLCSTLNNKVIWCHDLEFRMYH